MTIRFSLLLASLFLLLMPPASIQAQGPDSPPSATQGRMLWIENCQPCHGPSGQGDGPSAAGIPNPLPDLSDPETARQLAPANNFEVIKKGRLENLMPPWEDQLSDAQIWDLTAYVWLLSTTPQELEAGETVYQTQCAACHGESGAGDGPEAAAEMIDFTDLETMTARSQAELWTNYGASEAHSQLSLSDPERWPSLDYIRTFSLSLPQQNGVLTGQVINGTTGQAQGNIALTLRGFQGNDEIVNLTTQADGEGRFTFEKLPTDHTTFYMLEGEYEDIVYLSEEPGVFTPNSTETALDLTVYETTASDATVNIGQLHYILGFTPEAVNVAQIFVLNNDSDQTYIGQDGQTFAFALPENATAVTFQETFPGARFVQTDSGYADTAPIIPNAEDFPIAVQYALPIDDDTLTIEVPIPAKVNSLNVLMSEQGAELNSDQLRFFDTRQMQGERFEIYEGSGLNRGDTLTLQLSNLDDLEFTISPDLPGATAATGQPVSQDLLRWVTIGLGGLAIVLAVVVFPLTRPQVAQPADLDQSDPETQRQRLLLLLAGLDEAHQAGELDEAVYRQARTRYKAELAQMMEP